MSEGESNLFPTPDTIRGDSVLAFIGSDNEERMRGVAVTFVAPHDAMYEPLFDVYLCTAIEDTENYWQSMHYTQHASYPAALLAACAKATESE
jgi:hypothetical protein